jgi:hypothetical protein
MKKLKFLSLTILIVMAGFVGCKKDKKTDIKSSAPFQIISDPSFANSENALQAFYSKDGDSVQSYFYGSFNQSGVPEDVHQLIIRKKGETMSLNVFFDSEQRPSYLYMSTFGTSPVLFISFDYSIAGKTVGKLFKHDYSLNTSTLVAQKVFDNNSGQVALLNKPIATQNAAIGGTLLILFTSIDVDHDVDNFESRLFAGITAKIAAVTIPVLSALAVAVILPSAPVWLPAAVAILVLSKGSWASEIPNTGKIKRAPDDAPIPPANPFGKNYVQNIIGKWTLEKTIYKQGTTTITEPGSAGDFAQFDTNGKFSGNIFTSNAGVVTSTWEIIDNKIIKIKSNDEVDFPPSGFEIKTLTSNSLMVYAKRDNIEATFYLKK